jgi:hypothetical protein
MPKVIATPVTALSALVAMMVTAGVVGCGGASGGARGSLGGAAGAISSQGGSSGGGLGGMTAGSTGGAGVVPLSCTPGVDPAVGLLTDFSSPSWVPNMGKWSTASGDLTGSKYSAASTVAQADGGAVSMVTNTIDTTAANPSFQLTGSITPGQYGFGLLSFDKCVNTTKYAGVQFTIGGTTGGCDLLLFVQTFEQQGVSNRGGCADGSSCYRFPSKKLDPVTSSPAPMTVLFTDLTGGAPVGADLIKAEIVGLQWQFQSPAPTDPDGGAQPACTGIDVTIDDVQFVAAP